MLAHRRVAVAVVLATLSPLTLTVSPSPALAETVAGQSDPTAVDLLLTAPAPGRLSALSSRPIVDRHTRLDQLSDLVPDPAQHERVTEHLVAAGFTIEDQTTWSITAAAPQSVVAETFGVAPAAADDAALPTIPAALTDEVAAVYPDSETSALHPLSTGSLTGADIRNANTPATVTPSSASASGGVTVATLQFARWNQSDLTAYAAATGVADPVVSGQYRAVTVGSGPTSTNGASEVALDQESLLSVAPSARQTAYFAPNTGTGFVDAMAQVYDDVVGNQYSTSPDPHIVALSISWGNCEAAWGGDLISQMQTQLAALTAAGVTVFAASGDDGIYDCRGTSTTAATQPDVDFPASSPSVVAVGGTRLGAASSTPNLGTNWTESAWSCSSASSCHGAGGTGGGVSGSAYGHGVTSSQADFAGFAKPDWQADAVTDGPFATSSRRMVPDIAADGDPATGFRLILNGGWVQYGGTSLAAPLSAGQLASTLADAGASHGVGDIHAALYRAYTATRSLAVTDPNRVFRDVVSGSNGAATDAGGGPSVSAGDGYDTVSGLGGVLWGALLPYLNLTYTPPPVPGSTSSGSTAGSGPAPATLGGRIIASARLALQTTTRGKHRRTLVVAHWSTKATGGAVASTSIRITSRGKVVYTSTAQAGSQRLRARAGRPYVLTLVSYDIAGHRTQRSAHLTIHR